MLKRTLIQPKDALSAKSSGYQEHGTPINKLLNQRSMRALGRAFDLGIIRAPKKKGNRKK